MSCENEELSPSSEILFVDHGLNILNNLDCVIKPSLQNDVSKVDDKYLSMNNTKIYQLLKNENNYNIDKGPNDESSANESFIIHRRNYLSDSTDIEGYEYFKAKYSNNIYNIFYNIIQNANLEELLSLFIEQSEESKNNAKINNNDGESNNSFISQKRDREIQPKEMGKPIFSITKCNKYNHSEITKTGITSSKNEENAIIVINKENDDDKAKNNLEKGIFSEEDEFIFFAPGDKDSLIRKYIDQTIKKTEKKASKLLEIGTYRYSKKNRKRLKTIETKKENSYDLRKKIKSGFHKNLKDTFNENLLLVKALYKLDYFPQKFITNVNRKGNIGIINMKLEELLRNNFNVGSEFKQSIFEKYKNNLKVLEFLENNKYNTNPKFKFVAIKNMTYRQLYEEYLRSKEFEKEIANLKEKESEFYITRYIYFAMTLMDFFGAKKN